jgi:uncharacterized protein
MPGSILIAGFTLGLAGSFHCIGMCGPLSLALPVHHLSAPAKFFSLLLYQLGRIFTYSLIGLLLGLAGHRIYIAGYQQAFSITMGAVILMFALFYFLHRQVKLKFLEKYYFFVQQQVSFLLKSVSGPGGFLLMGMVNGLLPCGMVYVAMMTTLAFSEVYQSVVFMAMFGAGTLPAMMLVAYSGKFFKPGFRMRVKKLLPVFVFVMGLILVLRGLNLGIPFISPAFSPAPGKMVVCHP